MPSGERISSVTGDREERGERETTLRLREAFASLGETAAPRPDCPPPDRLWAAAIGESTAEERQEVVAHMATCASCASAFRLARGLSQEQASAQASPLTPVQPVRLIKRPWVRWGAGLAAAAALVAILTPLGLWQPKPPSPQYRGERDGEVRSLVHNGEDGATLPRDRAELLWTAGPPGSRYEVRVLTRDGDEVVVESGLKSPRYLIPPSVLTDLPPGALLHWQVKVSRPDGASAQSKTFSIRLE